MTKQKSDVWKIIAKNEVELIENENYNDLPMNDYTLQKELFDKVFQNPKQKQCRHKKTYTQNAYDMLNGFAIVKTVCCDCHKLLHMKIENTEKPKGVKP